MSQTRVLEGFAMDSSFVHSLTHSNGDAMATWVSLISALVAILGSWLMVEKKVRYSVLHEKRALVIEEMCEKIETLRGALFFMLNAYPAHRQSNDDGKSALEIAQTAKRDYNNFMIAKSIYFGDTIQRDLRQLNALSQRILVAVESGGAKERIEASVLLDEKLFEVKERVLRGFQKLLFVEEHPHLKALWHRAKTTFRSVKSKKR